MKHIFIINPIAGKGKYQHNIENNINNYFSDKDNDYEIYLTKYKGDAARFVIEKCEENFPCVFYSCGGDGTLHEVVNAACKYEHVHVGLIPCGTGNDFVRNFSNVINFENIELQIQGESVSLDLIKIRDEYAVSVCNIGFDADAAFNMHKFKKIPFINGNSCYILSVLYCLMKSLGKNLHIEIDYEEKISGRFLLCVVANGHSYGGGYKCAPLAKVNDGIIDVCLVETISRLKILELIKSYKEGTHLDKSNIQKYITYRKCKNVRIESNKPINLCIDGESYIYNDVNFDIVNNKFKFWVPKGTAVQRRKLNKNENINC
ncbi:YegS/Rv2252/BmrU family lipid kinase [Sedimentibacter acidaminivorans]|uniref:YegS/Rv2252/BmrU family lipid kinase n=1 Tax=Sedimentibacter acidaminivorans TaxID=913099 RepID=A0ABS4GDD1_9FIRM|nr:YegS/Rv2252/BmrU family lipid kinase [Sedimentibacter acidaminivorans]MBP1925696.1 YegS/Rv2252/BmrU family lipid kinase [Sedimentibacter acidaminivorans]